MNSPIPRLLVSIVRADEVAAAVAGGADIVDLKNPAEGSLGAPEPKVVRAVRRRVPEDTRLSVAVGDAPNLPGLVSLAAYAAASCGADYVKVGLYGVDDSASAVRLLSAVKRAVAETGRHVIVIAAGYADAHRVGALPPQFVPDVAADAGVDGCMLDTAMKDGSTLFDHLGPEQLAGWLMRARDAGLFTALAGSLRLEHFGTLRTLQPDVIGVRSAACIGDRATGTVAADRVRPLQAGLRVPITR